MKPATIGLAATAAALVLLASSSGPARTPAPGGTPGGAPPAPGGVEEIPPSDAEFVGIGELPTLERDLALARAAFGRFQHGGHRAEISWVELDCSRGGHEGKVFVSRSPLLVSIRARIPASIAPFGARYHELLEPWRGKLYEGMCAVNLRHPTAELVAARLGCHLPTTRIADLAWLEAGRTSGQITPQNQVPDAKMAYTHRMIAHYLAVHSQIHRIEPRPQIARPMGKDWATSKLLSRDRAVNFGWHSIAGTFASPGGLAVLQPLADAHTVDQVDYSQVVTLVSSDMLVNGYVRKLDEILRDPVLSILVSDEGPLTTTRHPLYQELAVA